MARKYLKIKYLAYKWAFISETPVQRIIIFSILSLLLSGIYLPIVLGNTEFSKHLEQAEQGDSDSQYLVGKYYLNGKESKGDFEKALHWLTLSANQGHMDAQYTIGYMYDLGVGVKKKHKTALQWYLKAANQGHTKAQDGAGELYTRGIGVPEDDYESEKWLSLAAAKGYPKAIFHLGELYESTTTNLCDYKKAYELYLKAGNLGIPEAYDQIGYLYEIGRGFPLDKKQAIQWYIKAATNGYASAQYRAGRILIDISELLETIVKQYANDPGFPNNIDMHNILTMLANTKRESPELYKKNKIPENLDMLIEIANHDPDLLDKLIHDLTKSNTSPQRNSLEHISAYRKTGIQWWTAAAKQNNEWAQSSLGLYYELGRYVPRDLKKAIAYYKNAAKQGNQTAIRCLRGLGVKY